MLSCGKNKVWLDPNEVNEIANANSRKCFLKIKFIILLIDHCHLIYTTLSVIVYYILLDVKFASGIKNINFGANPYTLMCVSTVYSMLYFAKLCLLPKLMCSTETHDTAKLTNF